MVVVRSSFSNVCWFWIFLAKIIISGYRDCGILEWNPVPFPIPSRTRIPSRYRFLRDTGWGLIQYVPRVDKKLTSVKNWVHTCPKNHKKLFLSAFFSVKMGHFLPFFVIICIKIAATNFLWQLHGVCWYWWLNTCIEGCLALVLPAQV